MYYPAIGNGCGHHGQLQRRHQIVALTDGNRERFALMPFGIAGVTLAFPVGRGHDTRLFVLHFHAGQSAKAEEP